MDQARRALGDLLSRPEGTWSLTDGALVVARLESPTLEPRTVHAAFERMAADARAALGTACHPRFVPPTLYGLLERRIGLALPSAPQREPAAWCLDSGLRRGLMAPELIAVVIAELARRAGHRFHVIAVPGRLLLMRRDVRERPLLWDPADRARELTPEACAERVAATAGGVPRFREGWLRPLEPTQVVARLITGIKTACWHQGITEQALAATRLLLAIRPDDPREIRDSGQLLFALGRYPEAIDAFEMFLASNPHGQEADAVRMLLMEARRGLSG
ncbi:MAG: hypothetical protein Kow0062_18270 [Acidobacteriota bacterium]